MSCLNSTFVSTSSPLSAALLCGRLRFFARASTKPGYFPPPPTTNTALTGLLPLSSIIFLAIFSVIFSYSSLTSSQITVESSFVLIPITSVKATVFFLVLSTLTLSASLNSIRYFLARASVISSPAYGIIPYAVTVPSLVIHISDVPAPTSTRARLSSLNFSGIATLIAAIGSSVRLHTLSPAPSTHVYKPSMTSSGRKVASSLTPTFIALWPASLLIGYPLR